MFDILFERSSSPQLLKKYNFILFFSLSQIFVSCCRDEIVPSDNEPIKQYCPEMYEARSKVYINPYMGTLNNGSVIPPSNTYPEKYSYHFPCTNPKNDFEICFCRMENNVQGFGSMDLFTYNFCTGKSKKIASNTMLSVDWGVNGWIIFTGSDGNLYKIKSSGDSLKQLTSDGEAYSAKWSPDGNSYICNGLVWMNKDGELIKNFNAGPSFFVWLNNEKIIEGKPNEVSKKFSIFLTDILNDKRELIAQVPFTGICSIEYLKGDNLFFTVGDPLGTSNNLYYTLNIQTKDTLRWLNCPFSFLPIIRKSPSNHLLVQQILRDTMTGNPLYLNYRSHIAIMDLDGKNERQVIIPE
ncbi:MAG: hypothetical protein JNM95_01205 [Chitinophagaceae bacterium]|nr:hypothetical protein [Chitinophagaceae bacterium]